jgi:hypothetical protein
MALGGLAMSAMAITIAGCGEEEVVCTLVALVCPEGEEECADPEDDGCEEYFDGEGECMQTLYCAPVADE